MGRVVIFDCDGVLVDSELLATRTDLEMLEPLGIHFTPSELLAKYAGVSLKDMLADISKTQGVRLPDDFHARCEARFERAIDESLEAVEGIAQVVDSVKDRACVASSSTVPRIRRSLAKAGLLDYFGGRIYSTTMVERGKPAPDVFLHAARRMGAAPADCVVIEDSVPGVTGAVAAGMTAIGFTAASHCDAGLGARLVAAGAKLVAGSSRELLATLT